MRIRDQCISFLNYYKQIKHIRVVQLLFDFEHIQQRQETQTKGLLTTDYSQPQSLKFVREKVRTLNLLLETRNCENTNCINHNQYHPWNFYLVIPINFYQCIKTYPYLCGQHFKSSSEGLSNRSTKDFPLESFGGKGGGFSSIVQILFLAKPCCSSDPQFPNCKESILLINKMCSESCK